MDDVDKIASREQIQSAAIQVNEFEQQLLIQQTILQQAIQNIQEKAVLIDSLLEMADEGTPIKLSSIPTIPDEYRQLVTVKKQFSEKLPSIINKFKHAIKHGNLREIERLLLDDRLDPSINNNAFFISACTFGQMGVVERLLQDKRVDPSDTNNKAIKTASQLGFLEIVNRLLQDPRVDPATTGNMPIYQASASGHVDVVNRLLQDPRVDPSFSNNRCIWKATFNGQLAVIDRLLQDPRVNPSPLNDECIVIAIDRGYTDIVRRLLQDPRVNPFTSYLFHGNTYYCLSLASEQGHLDIVELLLQDPWGPLMEIATDDNEPILLATYNCHTAIVKRLLQDPRTDPKANNNAALRIAYEKGYTDIVELLEQHGCSL